MARASAVGPRGRHPVRVAGHDRRGVARGRRVPRRRPVHPDDLDRGVGRHGAVRRRGHRGRDRAVVRQRTQSVELARPVRRRRIRHRRDRPPDPGARLGVGGVPARPGDRSDHADGCPRHPRAGSGHHGLQPNGRRPRGDRDRHRNPPRPGDGDLDRGRRAARPRRTRRAGRGGSRARRARLLPDLQRGDRRHRGHRADPDRPARRRRPVRVESRPGAAPQDGGRGDHAVHRHQGAPVRERSARPGRRDDRADGRPPASRLRYRGRDRDRRGGTERVDVRPHAAELRHRHVDRLRDRTAIRGARGRSRRHGQAHAGHARTGRDGGRGRRPRVRPVGAGGRVHRAAEPRDRHDQPASTAHRGGHLPCDSPPSDCP